ncbi:MAG: hypothetical protein JWM87_2438 [Candidatus Eremiobacteraeota bacterium]|nr:hypothetical protein [Candidatus Eremiobacteraeota bacterium]
MTEDSTHKQALPSKPVQESFATGKPSRDIPWSAADREAGAARVRDRIADGERNGVGMHAVVCA